MTFIAIFLSAVIGLNLIVLMHEFGHAFAMKKVGVKIKDIIIGLPIPFLTKLKFEWTSAVFPGTPITIFPLPLLGKAEMAENVLSSDLSYRDLAFINAGGGYVNLLFGMFIYFSIFMVGGQFSFAIPLGCAMLVMLIFPRGFAIWMMPFIGIIMLTLTLWVFTHRPLDELSGGPITFFSDIAAKGYSPGQMICFIADISLGLGLANFIPIPPLDGGAAPLWFLYRRYAKTAIVFQVVGIAVILVAMIWGLWTDIKLVLSGVYNLLF